MLSLVVPAAGNGTRLGLADTPKALAPLGVSTLLGTVLERIGDLFDEIVIVTKPGREAEFREGLSAELGNLPVTFATQPEATGSLDAVRRGLRARHTGSAAVVVWCDQVGVSRETVTAIRDELKEKEFVVPYISTTDPYVWLEMDENRRVVNAVGRSRDGDVTPSVGSADLGVFGFGPAAAAALADEEVRIDVASSREADFTYCIPVFSSRYLTRLLETDDRQQLIAVNTAEDLARAEEELSRKGGGR